MNNPAGCNRADTAYRLMNVIANLFHQGRGVGKKNIQTERYDRETENY